MTVFLGSDHAGFKIKEKIKKMLEQQNTRFQDLGTHSEESCDYPDYAKKVAKKVASKKNSLGILVCGTGTGTAITANKTKGIRAAQATNTYMAKMAREHNNANILSLGARLNTPKKALEMAKVFLTTPFSNEQRHIRRVKKIEQP